MCLTTECLLNRLFNVIKYNNARKKNYDSSDLNDHYDGVICRAVTQPV